MTTLRDIAKKAAVSTATVSNVLNDTLPVSAELRSRVMAVARELNYQPNTVARSLRLRRTHTIGMVVPDITNPFFPAVVRGAEDVLTRAGFTLVIGNSDNDPAKEEAYYRNFLERQIDGLITVPTADQAPPSFKGFEDKGISVIYVDRCHSDQKSDWVVADNQRASERCVRHLTAQGYRRIATISGPLHLTNARERLDGYRKALTGAGLPQDEQLIREGAYDIGSGRECTEQLLSFREPPDALFVANALMACGALQAIQASHLSCPYDIAIACFDELDFFDLLTPRLTRVAAPTYELGARGASLLLKRLSGETTGPGRRHVLSTPLIPRESSVRRRPLVIRHSPRRRT